MEKAEREAAVAWTREQLADLLETLRKIEDTASRSDLDVLEIAEHLNDLASSDDSWRGQAEQLGDLTQESLRRAFSAGLAGSTEAPFDHAPYIQLLKDIFKQSETSAKHFDALSLHAANFIDRGEPLAYELRLFVCKILRNDLKRPSQRGAPLIHPAREKVLYALLLDIMDKFGVPGTRARNQEERTSACDILREAIPNRSGLPKSYVAIERIFLAGNKSLDD